VSITRHRRRSAPVYVKTGEVVVSLVYEVADVSAHYGKPERPTGVRVIEPVAVHLIDDTGVQRLGFGASSLPLVAVGAAFVFGPLQWVLFGRRRQNRG
jgi:hypothetical protein